MGAASNEAKRRWNADNYTQVKFWAPPETAAAFKAKCIAEGVSMASAVIGFMKDKIDAPATAKQPLDITSRRKRRKAVEILVSMVAAILEAEQRYIDRAPENLRGASAYEVAEETVSALEEALEALKVAY